MLLDGSEKVTLTNHESAPELLDGLNEHGQVVRWRWFTKGFYKVWQNGDEVIMTDLRMGLSQAMSSLLSSDTLLPSGPYFPAPPACTRKGLRPAEKSLVPDLVGNHPLLLLNCAFMAPQKNRRHAKWALESKQQGII